MQSFLRTLLVPILLLAIFLLGSTNPVNAQTADDFTTQLITTYDVQQSGVTTVTHAFTITNNTPTTFIKQYALTTGYPDITGVTVRENGQPIEANIVTTAKQTSIAFDFPTELVGEGKRRQFSISYTNTDIALVGGKVLEVHVPELGNPELYDSHTVVLKTPLQFGEPVRIQPTPTSTRTTSVVETTFNNSDGKAISVYFGEEQFYNLTLRYHLDNPGSSTALAQIALPPETSFQELFYHDIDPQPEKIEQDQDGNWIATLRVGANTTLPVHVTTTAKITLSPNTRVPVLTPVSSHTSRAPYWETTNANIETKAQQYRTPEEMYDFVVESLDYTATPITDIPERLGAAKALKQPRDAVCQEFADLFVALSRANNIPARRLTGYAHSQNQQLRPLSLVDDVLHAWPEYYDSQRNIWIPVDPTWEDTTGGVDYFSQFDLNHIVFAINGVSSETPYPAGSYKLADQATKDIDVTFANTFPTAAPEFEISTQPVRLFGVPVPGFYQLIITNRTGQAWYTISADTQTAENDVHIQPIEIGTLLPFATKSVPFTLNTDGWQLKSAAAITIRMNNNNDQQLYTTQLSGLTAGPAVFGTISEPKILVGLAVFSILGTLVAGSVLVFRRK